MMDNWGRNIENAVKTRLQPSRQRHGRSMEKGGDFFECSQRREIPSGGLGTDISRLFMKNWSRLGVANSADTQSTGNVLSHDVGPKYLSANAQSPERSIAWSTSSPHSCGKS